MKIRTILAAAPLAVACARSPKIPPVPPPTRLPAPAVSRVAGAHARRIFGLFPPSTRVGEPFNRQDDGESAILVGGWGFEPGDRIFWNDRELTTSCGDPTTISALVPPPLLARPGTATIVIRNPKDASSKPMQARFEILDR